MNKEKMIELLKMDLRNECHHLDFYLYASSAIVGLHREELSEFFSDAANSEMNHVKEFRHVLNGLGCSDIRIKSHIEVPNINSAENLLRYAIAMEQDVVNNYYQRIKDAELWNCADGKFLEIFLENQLLDSKNDAIHMSLMLEGM